MNIAKTHDFCYQLTVYMLIIYLNGACFLRPTVCLIRKFFKTGKNRHFSCMQY